jgi:hypothetical protein
VFHIVIAHSKLRFSTHRRRREEEVQIRVPTASRRGVSAREQKTLSSQFQEVEHFRIGILDLELHTSSALFERRAFHSTNKSLSVVVRCVPCRVKATNTSLVYQRMVLERTLWAGACHASYYSWLTIAFSLPRPDCAGVGFCHQPQRIMRAVILLDETSEFWRNGTRYDSISKVCLL